MSVIETIREKAKTDVKHIVLPEGSEERTVQAAQRITEQGIARVTLIGDPGEIQAVASKFGVCLQGVDVIDPKASADYPRYCETFAKMRAKKGVTLEQAQKTMLDPLFFAAMMVYDGKADGFVSGAINTTGNTLRPGLQIIKTAPGVSAVSSFNLMIAPAGGNKYLNDGLIFFADCGLNPTYTAEGLADCAIATAKSAKEIAGIEPCVAMLSFSTMGSAKHDNVTLVQEATRIAKEKAPDLALDGELQFDAAIVPEVAALKAPKSRVAGHANVCIFPDLQAGNIGYKIAERLGGFQAIGPICQGFAKPLNDLSRGCKASDIVCAVAITALQVRDDQ